MSEESRLEEGVFSLGREGKAGKVVVPADFLTGLGLGIGLGAFTCALGVVAAEEFFETFPFLLAIVCVSTG